MRIWRYNIGLTYIVITLAIISLLIYSYFKRKIREDNPAYTIGIITGRVSGGDGNEYLAIEFNGSNEVIDGIINLEFCPDCNIGDSLFVEYDINHPHNFTLVENLPKGKSVIDK